MKTLGKVRIDEKTYDVDRIELKGLWASVYVRAGGKVTSCHDLPRTWVEDPIGTSIYVNGHRYSTCYG